MRLSKYPITPEVEKLIAYAECSNPRFHEQIGHAIEPERMTAGPVANLVAAAQAIARDGTPCGKPIYAIQQMRTQVHKGKITMEDLGEASDLLDAVEDAGGVSDLDGLIAVTLPAVQGVAYMAAVEQTVKEMGHGVSPGEAAERFEAIAQLGISRVSMGSGLSWDDTAAIAADAVSTVRDPLPTGITELDIILGGGAERASLGVVLGGPGDGKSLFLCHVATEAILEGRSVGYVTLELSEAAIKQRIRCNLVDMTAAEMAANPLEAQRRWQIMDALCKSAASSSALGSFHVVYMTPKVGSINQMKSWLEDIDRQWGATPEVLIVDYADKMTAKVPKGNEGSSYVEQGKVYDQLRSLVVDRDGWGWTASQTTGREGRKKKVDIEDMADSMEKARIADTVIAISRTQDDCDGGFTRFRLPKRRNGRAHEEVGPLSMDPERGRIVQVSRANPW